MAQISVMDADKTDNASGEESVEELEEASLEKAESRDNEEEAVPLEKMTNAELIKKIDQLQELADNNHDLFLRSQAEIENLKKRFQKEKQGLVKFSNESLIKQLLPSADNLEKAIAHSEDDNWLNALREGVNLTLKGLMDTLEKAGVESVEAIGKPFDPNLHEAVSEVRDDTVEPGTVIKELQKGYTLNQRLIRPSMVIVSQKT